MKTSCDIDSSMCEFLEKEETKNREILEDIEKKTVDFGKDANKKEIILPKPKFDNDIVPDVKDYQIYRAEKFLENAFEKNQFRDRYAILLNNYYKSTLSKLTLCYADYVVGGVIGACSACAFLNDNSIGGVVSACLGILWLGAGVKSHISKVKDMHENIEDSKKLTEKQNLALFYIDGKENTHEYLGKLSLRKYKKVLKSARSKFNLEQLINQRETALANDSKKQIEREKVGLLQKIIAKNKMLGIVTDVKKEENLLNK